MPLLALLRRHLQQQLLPLLSLQYVHLTSHAKRCDLLLLSPAHTHIRSSYFRPIPNTGTNVWCASFTRGVSVALRDAHPCRSSACICTQPCLCMSFSRLWSEPPAVIFLRFGLANSSQILPISLYIKDVCEILLPSVLPLLTYLILLFFGRAHVRLEVPRHFLPSLAHQWCRHYRRHTYPWGQCAHQGLFPPCRLSRHLPQCREAWAHRGHLMGLCDADKGCTPPVCIHNIVIGLISAPGLLLLV
jgi:hypothetical protein